MNIFQAFLASYPLLSLLLFSVCALLVGSVLGMLSYRLPLMSEDPDKWPTFNLFYPRSHCVHCKKIVPFYYNIPVVSYLILHGRCHACRYRIAWRYPLIELLCLLLSLIDWYYFGWHWPLLPALLFTWVGLALTVIDLEHQLLPDVLTYSLLWIGLLVNTQSVFCTLSTAVWGAVIAYLSLWLLIKLFYLIRGKIGMGHGDFKLFAALGAWFGWPALSPLLLIACTLGMVIGSIYLWANKKNRHHPIPFGPYLCIAGMLYLTVGTLRFAHQPTDHINQPMREFTELFTNQNRGFQLGS